VGCALGAAENGWRRVPRGGLSSGVPNELLSRFRSYDYLLAFVAMPVGYGIPAILPVVRAVAAPPLG
jgi:hypothetical protein